MKIFILEDRSERLPIIEKAIHNYYKKVTKIVIAESNKEAKLSYWEENGIFDVLFLDHDLGGNSLVSSEKENTGFQFAKFLVETDKHLNEKQIFIHSLNEAGAKNMNFILPTSVIVPITNFKSFFGG